MKVSLRITIVLAIAVAAISALAGYKGTEAAQAGEERVPFGELVEKDGVYYLNNVPFTGVANRWDYGETIWTMKDGILHGPFSSSLDACWDGGDYKNGMKDGKWESGCFDEENTEKTIEMWKDDKKHGEWEYFLGDQLYKTETYENDKLIKQTWPETGVVITTFTDSRDGETYQQVTIGTQTWMAENLKYAAEGSEYYENKDDYYVWLGSLYNWETAMKVCPQGWHLPSDEEWTTLIDFAGGSDVAGKKLKSAVGWSDGDGTNDYGFSALPGGGYAVGEFDGVGERGAWWGASEESATSAWTRHMQYDGESVDRGSGSKGELCSVRCVQDNK